MSVAQLDVIPPENEEEKAYSAVATKNQKPSALTPLSITSTAA